MTDNYNELDFSALEKKWQKKWEEKKIFEVKEDSKKKKYYMQKRADSCIFQHLFEIISYFFVYNVLHHYCQYNAYKQLNQEVYK
jgi:hypothetical protein